MAVRGSSLCTSITTSASAFPRGRSTTCQPGILNRYRRFFAPASDCKLSIHGAEDSYLFDQAGHRYIDLTSGWNVANVGWNNRRVVDATRRQLTTLPYVPSWCASEAPVVLAEKLEQALGQKLSMIGATGGTEAVEMALKVARRATGRQVIVGISECYHGSTRDAALAGGVPSLHENGQFAEYYRHIPIPDPVRSNLVEAIEAAVNVILQRPWPAAVLLETVMTNPGVIIPPAEFLDAVQGAARETGALIIADEIGTGFGRTGSLFAYQQSTIRPDIIVVAKAFSGGVVPIGGAILLADLGQYAKGLAFDSTFACTPLACAAAHETICVIEDENLCDRSGDIGAEAIEYLKRNVVSLSVVADVRGMGMEIAIELTDDAGDPLPYRDVDAILVRCRHGGVFVERSRYTSSILVMPPLTIHSSDLTGALDTVISSIAAKTR